MVTLNDIKQAFHLKMKTLGFAWEGERKKILVKTPYWSLRAFCFGLEKLESKEAGTRKEEMGICLYRTCSESRRLEVSL